MTEQATDYKGTTNGTKPTGKPKKKQRSAGIPQVQALNSMQEDGVLSLHRNPARRLGRARKL